MDEAKEFVVLKTKLDSPLFTVGIPTYKRAKLLVQAVQSCLNQDFPHSFEILVMDNNPERYDETEKCMSEFCHEPQISYYKNVENIGMTGNFRKIFEMAKGKYVVVLHDDDLMLPWYMKIQLSLLEATKYQYELQYPSFIISKDRMIPDMVVPKELIYRVFKREDYLVTQWGLPSGMMLLKTSFSKIGRLEDLDVWFPIADQLFFYKILGFLKGCVVYFPMIQYNIGVNTSMQANLIIMSIIKAKEFNYLMRKDKLNHWRFFAFLSYRNQIANQISWARNFVSNDVINDAKKQIDLRDNYIMDKVSFYFVKLLKKYLNRIRIHRFVVK